MRSITPKLIVASTLLAVALASSPAMAICKYGTPHCIDPNPGPKLPKINTNRLPDSPPGDDDCKYYGNCDDGSPEGTGPDGGPNGGLGTDTHQQTLTGGDGSQLLLFPASFGLLAHR